MPTGKKMAYGTPWHARHAKAIHSLLAIKFIVFRNVINQHVSEPQTQALVPQVD
jgi:hypothetical protein